MSLSVVFLHARRGSAAGISLCPGRISTRRNSSAVLSRSINRICSQRTTGARFSTTAEQSLKHEPQLSHHRPPFPVRVALVSAATAVATPVFPAIGFVNVFLRFTLPEPNLRAALSSTIGTVLSFATWTLIPAFYDIAPAVLPCAAGNGLVAGASYAALDTLSGGPKSWLLHRNPLAGGAIGAVTGFVAPYFCYGPIFSLLYGLEGVTESTRMLLAFPLATEITITTGFAAGLAMCPLLYFPMNGLQGVHWTKFSAPTLLAVALALCCVYSPDERMSVPEGVFIEPTKVPLLDSIVRYNVTTREAGAFSISSGTWIGPAEMCEEGQRLASVIRQSTVPAFDDRLVAWLDTYTSMDAATKYPGCVVCVQEAKSIRAKEHAMLGTDGVVAFIVDRSTDKGFPCDKSVSETRAKLLAIVDKMDRINQRNSKLWRRAEKVKSIEAMSVAVELLMLLKEKETMDHINSSQADALTKDLERYVKRNKQEIMLFAAEEEIDGESVESQLQALAWNGNSDIAAVITAWEQVNKDDKQRRRMDLGIGALILSLGALLLLDSHH